MSTITLVANTDYSDLTVADDDTIELAGFTLSLDVVPAQTGVQVITPGTAGKVVLGAPTVYTLPGWQFTAGTGALIALIPAGTTFGGNITGGSASGAHGVSSNYGTITGDVTGGTGGNATGCFLNYGTIAGTLTGGGASTAYGTLANEGNISGSIFGGTVSGAHGVSQHRSVITGLVNGGSAVGAFGVGNCLGVLLGGTLDSVGSSVGAYGTATTVLNGPLCRSVLPPSLAIVYSLFGPINPLATVDPGTQIIILSGNTAAAFRLGNRIAQRGVNL